MDVEESSDMLSSGVNAEADSTMAPPPTHRSLADLQAEQTELLSRLHHLRQKRRMVQEHTSKCRQFQQKNLDRISKKQQERQEAVEAYTSILREREAYDTYFDCAKGWNVLDDCFYIWSTGGASFASINGCRMGADAHPLPPELRIHQNTARQQQSENLNTGQETPPSQPRYFGLFQGNEKRREPITNTSVCHTQQQQHHQHPPSSPSRAISPPPPSENSHVPWLEVNAALGHACLLLQLIQEKSLSNMTFTHVLHPMAMTSKIGVRFGRTKEQSQKAEPVLYNLYLDEDAANAAAAAANQSNAATSSGSGSFLPFSFSLFKNQHIRNFNYALQAFLQCIAEAAEDQQQFDKTMGLPYPIEFTGNKGNTGRANNHNAQFHLNGGEWTVGGLPICYPTAGSRVEDYHQHHLGNVPTTPTIEWTRACKYLLTDLKWLVAFTAKHVDR